jgi:hypothetical protein
MVFSSRDKIKPSSSSSNLLLLRTGTHTHTRIHMDEPITCAGELEELVLALALEVESLPTL